MIDPIDFHNPSTRPLRRIEVTVRNDDRLNAEAYRLREYLYSNFSVFSVEETDSAWATIVVTGRDRAGFTAEAVAARLGSGSFGAKVVA